MYDILIVGAGPAGLSAAMTARSRNKKVLVVSNKPENSLLAKSKRLDNYPGMPSVSGLNLLTTMLRQASDLGVEFVFEQVSAVMKAGEYFQVSTSSEAYQARSIILATGKNDSKALVGENEFIGRGVSHCATCDGMFFKNATVAVVGLSNDAPKEANFLAELGATVHYVSPKLPEGLSAAITAHHGKALEIKGDKLGVTELLFESAETKEPQAILCAGVFVLRAQIAPNALIRGLNIEGDHIAINANKQTNVAGVFAAGDCVGAPLQVAKAVGEGQLACFAAIDFVEK